MVLALDFEGFGMCGSNEFYGALVKFLLILAYRFMQAFANKLFRNI